MKISASLYANPDKSFPQLVQELDECHIDYFHIDCSDDLSVFEDINKIRELSQTPIDLHIISSKPEQYFELIEEHQVEYVSFQYESIDHDIVFPKSHITHYGLAIASHTPTSVFSQYQDQCDFVLIMTTVPGESGGQFRKENFKKIRKFRNQFPGKLIHVDGGVNDETGFVLRILGVQSVVSGSYLTNHRSIGTALLHLKSSIIHSDYQVKDFMIDLEDAPVVSTHADVKEIFQTIENYQLGFTLVRNENNTLFGLSSNADMRRGLLKHLDDLNRITTQDIINVNPVMISENATISELLDVIQSEKFLISYLPVVNEAKKLVGALSFINLIRSES